MARKYLIETFGCQMNVHDSERMAGLLEQAGFEPTRDARRRRPRASSTPAACASGPRTSCSRGSASCGSWPRNSGHDPIVAVAGCVAQQEGGAMLKRARRRRRRDRRHPGDPASADAGRPAAAQRRRRPVIDLDPYEDVTFPLGVDAPRAIRSRPTSRSSKAATSSAVSASCPYTRGTSGCVPRPTSWPRCARRPTAGAREVQLLGQIVNHYDGAGRSACDFAGLLEAIHDVQGIERIRFASPHPRHVSARFLDAMRAAAEGLPPSAPAGAVRVDASARGDAASLHARELSRSGRRRSASGCRTSRCRPT